MTSDLGLVTNFFAAQRTLRRLHMESNFTLSLPEIHLLIELEYLDRTTATEICEGLFLDQSVCSRRVTKLARLGFIDIGPDLSDQRRKVLALSTSGREVLRSQDLIVDRSTKLWWSILTEQEQDLLFTYLMRLADHLGAPKRPERKEVPIRRPQRRIAIAGGLFGSQLFSSSFSLVEFHTLLTLFEAASGVRLGQFFKLPFDKAAVSRALKLLEVGKVLRRTKTSAEPQVFLTAPGRKRLTQDLNQLQNTLRAAVINDQEAALSTILNKIANYD